MNIIKEAESLCNVKYIHTLFNNCEHKWKYINSYSEICGIDIMYYKYHVLLKCNKCGKLKKIKLY